MVTPGIAGCLLDGRNGLRSRTLRPPARNQLVHELLTAVDVERRAGERGVGHDVDGQRGNVGGGDDAPNGECRPQLIAALLEPVAEQRCRQRGVDEPGRDEVDAYWRKLQREGRRERRQDGGGGGEDP